MTYVYVLLIYISVGGKLELTSAQMRLERDECMLLAENINAGSSTDIAACMPILKEDEHGL